MRGKAALSDDEILLSYILAFEGRGADHEELIKLYGTVLPATRDSYYDMLQTLEMCGWSGSDFDVTFTRMSLEERLCRLVPCAIISTRNIPDVCQRARQAYIMIERLFKRRELPRLSKAIDEAMSGIASDTGDGRRVTHEAMRLFENDGARDALRHRAARARALGVKRQTRATYQKTRDVKAAVEVAARELFPNGFSSLNALALRVLSRRVSEICPDADDERVKLALDSMRGGHSGV